MWLFQIFSLWEYCSQRKIELDIISEDYIMFSKNKWSTNDSRSCFVTWPITEFKDMSVRYVKCYSMGNKIGDPMWCDVMWCGRSPSQGILVNNSKPIIGWNNNSTCDAKPCVLFFDTLILFVPAICPSWPWQKNPCPNIIKLHRAPQYLMHSTCH